MDLYRSSEHLPPGGAAIITTEERVKTSAVVTWVAWSGWGLSMSQFAGSLILAYASDQSSLWNHPVVGILATLTLVTHASVGAFIALRRPDNPIGSEHNAYVRGRIGLILPSVRLCVVCDLPLTQL